MQSFSRIRVLSTGKSEPHLIYKRSLWLSIIKTIVAMAIQRVLQIYERLMSWLFVVVVAIGCSPSLGLLMAGRKCDLGKQDSNRVMGENLKLNFVPKVVFSIVPQCPACLIQ